MRCKNPMVIHYVHDMARASGFYQSVFDVSPVYESSGWTELDFGDVKLALHILAPGHDTERPLPHAGLNLEVDHIEEMEQRIADSGGQMLWMREPEPHVPDRVASFRDTEGNVFELRQPVEAH